MPVHPMQSPAALRRHAGAHTARAAHAATAVVAAMLGWCVHALAVDPPASAPAQASPTPPPAAPATPWVAQPFIALASDGNITLRVEQQPLDWVLAQIAAQSGGPLLHAPARPAAAQAPASGLAVAAVQPLPAPAAAGVPVMAACPDAAALRLDPQRLLHSIENGSEAERFQGLMLARAAGITLADTTLQSLYEYGASERVQVAAFEAWLALRADRPAAVHAGLVAALNAPAPAIRLEAQQRLASLAEAQRQAGLPPLADP